MVSTRHSASASTAGIVSAAQYTAIVSRWCGLEAAPAAAVVIKAASSSVGDAVVPVTPSCIIIVSATQYAGACTASAALVNTSTTARLADMNWTTTAHSPAAAVLLCKRR